MPLLGDLSHSTDGGLAWGYAFTFIPRGCQVRRAWAQAIGIKETKGRIQITQAPQGFSPLKDDIANLRVTFCAHWIVCLFPCVCVVLIGRLPQHYQGTCSTRWFDRWQKCWRSLRWCAAWRRTRPSSGNTTIGSAQVFSFGSRRLRATVIERERKTVSFIYFNTVTSISYYFPWLYRCPFEYIGASKFLCPHRRPLKHLKL